jgi:hypothetical protein
MHITPGESGGVMILWELYPSGVLRTNDSLGIKCGDSCGPCDSSLVLSCDSSESSFARTPYDWDSSEKDSIGVLVRKDSFSEESPGVLVPQG